MGSVFGKCSNASKIKVFDHKGYILAKNWVHPSVTTTECQLECFYSYF